MTARAWVYSKLVQATQSLVDGRVYAKKSMTSSVEDHPFVVYKFGHQSSALLGEDGPTPGRQFIQVWIHDYNDNDHADYTRIDEVIAQVKSSLHLGSSAADGIISCEYLETSQDLNDDTLNTVFRYVRFHLIIYGKQ